MITILFLNLLKAKFDSYTNRAKQYEKENISTDNLKRVYSLNDIERELFDTAIMSEKLLKEKGFSLSLTECGISKSVFLNTEISELADAVKKGLGEEAEGLELADISIRAAGILVCFETKDLFKDLHEQIMNKLLNKKIEVKLCTNIDSDLCNKKIDCIENMMNLWFSINLNLKKSIQLNNTDSDVFIKLWKNITKLICCCKLYCDVFLHENLQDYINEKMEINFKRPIKYNTSKNIIS